MPVLGDARTAAHLLPVGVFPHRGLPCGAHIETDERLFDEPRECPGCLRGIEVVNDDGNGGLEREGADKDGEPAQYQALGLRQ